MIDSEKLILFFISINFSWILNAQITDTTNIISYNDKIMVKANLDTQTEDFAITDQNEIYRLSLNSKIKLSLSLDYKIISASISFSPKFISGNNDNESKGKSAFTDLKFRFFPGRFIQTFHYKRLKGFYLKNTPELLPEWNSETNVYIQFPDLKQTTYGGSTSFIFNPEFSLKSLLYQREWQKFSAGSLIPSVSYDLSFLTNDFGTFKAKERELDFGLELAYYYNWVIAEKFAVAPYTYIGGGVRYINYRKKGTEINSSERDNYITYKYGAGIHLGFNSDKFLFGGRINFDSFNYKQNQNRFADNSLYGLFFVGYRFSPPKKVEKIYEKLEQKNPF